MGLIKRFQRGAIAQPATPIIYATDDRPRLSYVGPQSLGIGPGEMIIGSPGNRALWGNMGTITKTFAPWVPGSSAGGRVSPAPFSGSESLYVYAIGNGEDSDVAIDSSPVGANIPTGWNWQRMIGAFLLSDGNLRDFYQENPRFVEYKTSVLDKLGLLDSGTTQIHTLSVPDSGSLISAFFVLGVAGLYDARTKVGRVSQTVVFNLSGTEEISAGGYDPAASTLQSFNDYLIVAENRQIKQAITPFNNQTIFLYTKGYYVHL